MYYSLSEHQGMAMDVVTGATGQAGSEIVRALVGRGREVRAFVRDPEKARRRFGDAVEPAIGDFADSAAVRAALQGADTVVLSGPDDPRRVGWETKLVDVAVESGVRRIVKLSSIVAEVESPVAFWEWHARIEAHLLRSGVSAAIVRSAPYMSNVLLGAEGVAAEGRLYAPAGSARIAMIDPTDVGASVAAVAASSGWDGPISHVVTGPEAITYTKMAATLSAATGREVEYVEIPDAAAEQAMVRAGLPDPAAEQVVNVFKMLRRGVAEQVTTTVESLTGRRPRDFAAFAHQHANLFAPAAAAAAR